MIYEMKLTRNTNRWGTRMMIIRTTHAPLNTFDVARATEEVSLRSTWKGVKWQSSVNVTYMIRRTTLVDIYYCIIIITVQYCCIIIKFYLIWAIVVPGVVRFFWNGISHLNLDAGFNQTIYLPRWKNRPLVLSGGFLKATNLHVFGRVWSKVSTNPG